MNYGETKADADILLIQSLYCNISRHSKFFISHKKHEKTQKRESSFSRLFVFFAAVFRCCQKSGIRIAAGDFLPSPSGRGKPSQDGRVRGF
jgi:hypothetical protein